MTLVIELTSQSLNNGKSQLFIAAPADEEHAVGKRRVVGIVIPGQAACRYDAFVDQTNASAAGQKGLPPGPTTKSRLAA